MKMHSLIAGILEIAAAGDSGGDMIYIDPVDDYLRAALTRADKLLDRRRDAVFFDVLNIPSKTAAQRVALAYDATYLLGLGLSLDATIELAQELTSTLDGYGVTYTGSLAALAKGVADTPEDREFEQEPVTIRRPAVDD